MADTNGLFIIYMADGGQLPQICYDRFTNYKSAKKALLAYIQSKVFIPAPLHKTNTVAKAEARKKREARVERFKKQAELKEEMDAKSNNE